MQRGRVAAIFLLAACTNGSPAEPRSREPVTYYRDVLPILERHCQTCHSPGGVGPFPLHTYEDVRLLAPAMHEETTSRRMPPWGALDSDECKPRLPWRNDARLSDAELQTLADWDAAGAPAGNSQDRKASQAPVIAFGKLAAKTHELTADPVTVTGTSDAFKCIVIDPHLPDGTLLAGLQFVPSTSVLHHAEVWAQDAVNDKLCDTMTPSKSTTLLQFYLPGSGAIDLPDDIAMRLPNNARFVVNAHFSAAGKTVVVTPRLQLRVTDKTPKYLLTTANGFGPADDMLPGVLEPDGRPKKFRIPPGDRRYVVRYEVGVPASLDGAKIYSVAAHEHLAGTDMKIDLVQPDPGRAADEQCLLQDRWDFHWQQSYTYDVAPEHLPTLHTGDKLLLRCTFNNSMSNRRLAAEYRARGLPLMDIVLGRETLNEMCVFLPRVLVEARGK